MTKAETRTFQMHPDLLYSVIKAQAGTHEKALLEAVMNAVDAGASQCQIDLDEKGYIITDDGKGFSSRTEIENFFETFGTPHKEGDATYGKFRMGRGQLFAFSRTVWHSNQFMMDVCIKTKGLDYIFLEKQPVFKGCKITGTWHEKLRQHEILNLSRELKLLVKYMQIPIVFNGENISLSVKEQKWDKETAQAYIKTSANSGTLSVYNLGALVCHYPASKFGIGGVVVAKEQLTVNFARNDVLINQCKVWKKISQTLNEMMGIETKKKSVLTEAERIAMVNNLLGGVSFLSQYLSKGIFTDICSKKPTVNSLFKIERLSFSTGDKTKHMLEEKIHTQELAFILDASMLDRFDVDTPEQFVEKINSLIELNNIEARNYQYNTQYNIHYIYQKFNPKIIPIKSLLSSFKSTFEFKNEKSITKKEKCVLNVMNEISSSVGALVETYQATKEKKAYKSNVRQISIGVSQIANAWTDGQTYIAFSDKFLKSSNATSIVHVMLHEYCHNELTNETHSHGIEFYEMFHDIMTHHGHAISVIIHRFNTLLLGQLTKAGIKAPGIDIKLLNEEKLQEIMA